ncbi:zinc ribbon domain-containing protein [Bifidobacterium miconisargentati]|uniref:zinc ribbon domain-containing protein n=1 Tax=Bifidobacterium miconisargentati TaxID=2834437 RepID=UPI001BDCA134|nr:zinc ribbon domain-containing protein [Bifidobacterium miconisargentati]MBW3089620.1 zinc ribbon domain-containing protein [Bifidobacterium miconisargentati]
MSMFCHKCGNQIPNDSAFCSRCGASVRFIESSDKPDGREAYSVNASNSSVSYSRQSELDSVPSSKASTWKWIIAIFTMAAVFAAIVFIANHESGQSNSNDSQQNMQDQKQDLDQSQYPIVNAILTNCSSLQNISVQSVEDGKYVDLSFSMSGYDAKITAQDMNCIREQLGFPEQYTQYGDDNDYMNGYGLYVNLSSLALKENKKGNSDINSASFMGLGDSAITRCVVLDLQSLMVSCEIGDADSSQSAPNTQNDTSDGQANSSDTQDSTADDGADSVSDNGPGSPEDAVGYEKYKDYNCSAGNSGKLMPCSEIYADMGNGMNYLPFGRENNPDPSTSFGYIPVDENGNGVIDGNE